MAVDRPVKKRRHEQRDPTRAWHSGWLPLRHVFFRDNYQAPASVNARTPSPDSAKLDSVIASVGILITALATPSESLQTANATEPADVVDTPVADTTRSDSGSNHDTGTTNVDTNSDQHGNEAWQTDQADGLSYSEALLTPGDNSISSDDQRAVESAVSMVSGIIC
jgi:hypothetical protein